MLLDILEGQALPTSDREQTFAQRFGDERRQFLKKMGSIKAPLKSRSLSPQSVLWPYFATYLCLYIAWRTSKLPNIFIRYHLRFFVQVGHETTYAAIGNCYFFLFSKK